jgi:hypothetical protein
MKKPRQGEVLRRKQQLVEMGRERTWEFLGSGEILSS